jgi:hypothetical protein
MLGEAVARRAQFDAQMNALNIDRLLDANTLTNPDSFEPARNDLAQAARTVSQFQADIKAYYASVSQRLKEVGVEERFRKAAIDGMERQRATHGSYLERALQLDRAKIGDLTSLLDFVEPRLNRLRVSDGALICDEPSDDAQLLRLFKAIAANREARLKLEADARAAAQDFKKTQAGASAR